MWCSLSCIKDNLASGICNYTLLHVGTHGTGLTIGNIAALVTKLRIIDGTGVVRKICFKMYCRVCVCVCVCVCV